MLRKAVVIALFIFGFGSQVSADPQLLKLADIHRVVQRFFSFHIETRDFNTTMVRRSIKIYIEQFDSDKSYLLASEVAPYLNLSEEKAAAIMERIQNQDYSDYLALNGLFQRAIHRAEANRSVLAQQLMSSPMPNSGSSGTTYAVSEAELVERQKSRIIRFYAYQESRTNLDSMERRAKVFSLYERKVRRSEAPILFKDSKGETLSKDKGNHVFATKVLKSIAKSLDTHTTFFSPEEAHEMRLNLEKQFQGVGVVLSEGIDGVQIADLIKGSPAEKSGKIKVNDQLVEIDGMRVENLPFEEVLELLSKKGGGEILLGFNRYETVTKEKSFFQVALRKEPIVMDDERIQTSIEHVDGGIIGKISLHSFYESGNGVSSEADIKAAIEQFRSQGNLIGLVLDLRENAGGFLSQAVKVAGLFISNGVVVISKYGTGELNFLRSIAGRQYYNGPVVVLTSKMSASAAEIVAQSLQDYGVGIVVGDERTFGKGSIQYQTVTEERADLFFKITVGRYYTVSGKSTQIDGVQADIVVPTQYAPYNIGEKFLEYPLSRDSVKPAYVDPLTDLDGKTQKVFQKRYLPYLQRVVPFWKRILPELKKNSAARISRSAEYRTLLKRNERIRLRQNEIPVNTVDESFQTGGKDLQMEESVNILKDMIEIEVKAHPANQEKTYSLKGA